MSGYGHEGYVEPAELLNFFSDNVYSRCDIERVMVGERTADALADISHKSDPGDDE